MKIVTYCVKLIQVAPSRSITYLKTTFESPSKVIIIKFGAKNINNYAAYQRD